MEDRFLKLTQTEIKLITLLEYSTDFNNDDQVKKLRDMMLKKHYFSSETGLDYEKSFFDFANEKKSPVACVICGMQLGGEHAFLCPRCKSAVGKSAAAIVNDAKRPENSNPGVRKTEAADGGIKKTEAADAGTKKTEAADGGIKRTETAGVSTKKTEAADDVAKKIAASENRKKDLSTADDRTKKVRVSKRKKDSKKDGKKHLLRGIAIGFAACILLAAAVIGIISFSYSRRPERVTENILNDFNSALMLQGMKFGEGGIGEDGAAVYEILPQKDLFLVYADEKGYLEAMVIIMSGDDSVSNARHMLLMTLLNMAMNEGMTGEEATEHIQNMVGAGGEYHYGDYEWLLVPAEGMSYYFVMKEDLDSEDAGAITASSVSKGGNEISNLLGGDYEVAKTMLGESVEIIAENTRYFEGSGISLIYSKDTGEVLYIDEDGTGSDGKVYSICGISVGMSREQALVLLKQYGYAAGNGTSDVLTVSMETDGKKRELSVTIVNGVVGVVSYAIIN